MLVHRTYSFFFYILTNQHRTTLYCGVTNNLTARLEEHRSASPKSFTGRYNCHHLVYYEHFDHIQDAIAREKEVKKWRREKKERLIESTYPECAFLSPYVLVLKDGFSG